ncbi:MAG TPA: GNAT family N-acetyltransferase [Acidobacteriaceae bacterium]
MDSGIVIRNATRRDDEAIWQILEPVLRAGATYTLPREISREDALAYWFSPAHETFVAEGDGRSIVGSILGTYYLRANQRGGGAHVANCGYVTSQQATGRGIARAMCLHSLDVARQRGFRAMQFNFVVSTNERAVRLWTALGFATVGRLPAAFLHPLFGYVDALVMYRSL